MGIFINLSISKSVTKEEWDKVYQETLCLVDAFPLAERRKVPVCGIETVCLVPTKEREMRSGWRNVEANTGWVADGDFETLCTAEEYYLPKNLVTDESFDPDAPDALFCILPAYLSYEWDDPRFQGCYELWGAKTQGEPYHMYLLAIACLIESRLGPKACVYGDITKGQCRKAVEMANQYLDKEITMPDRCDMERLLKRVKSFPVSEEEMIQIYTCMYLGKKDASFGKAVRTYFSESVFEAYWKERLGSCNIKTIGFNDALKDYLLWGFSLEKLAEYVSFTDDEGNVYYDDYVRVIMDTRLYQKEKDCRDILVVDEEQEGPYGVPRLFAQFVFGAARNRKVDRYIPLEEIRRALISNVGDKCNVNQLIDKYLQEVDAHKRTDKTDSDSLTGEETEKTDFHDVSDEFNHFMDKRVDEMEERSEKYEIPEYRDLPYFKMGDSIAPDIAREAGKYFSFYRNLLTEAYYTELMEKSPEEKCKWLVFQNRGLLLRDKDWEKIYRDIMENQASFSRYYPMVRVIISGENVGYLIRAIATNDDFYQHVFSLEEKYGGHEEPDKDVEK